MDGQDGDAVMSEHMALSLIRWMKSAADEPRGVTADDILMMAPERSGRPGMAADLAALLSTPATPEREEAVRTLRAEAQVMLTPQNLDDKQIRDAQFTRAVDEMVAVTAQSAPGQPIPEDMEPPAPPPTPKETP